jgi:hypothetical protein
MATSTVPKKSSQQPRPLPLFPQTAGKRRMARGREWSRLRATFSPAHPLARRDVPLARARAFKFSLLCPRGAARLSFTARIGRAPFHRARSASKKDGLAAPYPTLPRPRVARAGEHSRPLATNHTVKCCFTISALNSLLFPDTTTAPLAITTYFSARRAAKWSPCSTNKMAKRR